MLPQSNAGHLAAPTDSASLVLDRLPSGELAWLRPESDGSDARRVVLTQRGRDLLARLRAEHWLFGRELA